jgi:hypothetical protein
MATDPVEILRQRNAEVEQIRGYVDLTEEAKQRRIAEVNERAQAEYREAIETQERERAERLQKSKRSVFQIPIPLGATDGEAAQIRASYRSARSDIEYAIAPQNTQRSSSASWSRPSLQAILSWRGRRITYQSNTAYRAWSIPTSPVGRRRAGHGSVTRRRTRRLMLPGVPRGSSSVA